MFWSMVEFPQCEFTSITAKKVIYYGEYQILSFKGGCLLLSQTLRNKASVGMNQLTKFFIHLGLATWMVSGDSSAYVITRAANKL